MYLKDIDKLVRKAKKEKKVLVLNFSDKELEYANRAWLVVQST